MEILFKTVLILSAILVYSVNHSVSYQVKTEKDAVAYLTHYGYVDTQTMPRGFTLKDCNKKLKEFQKLARVDVTGVFDASTMKAMNSPRCGCPDFIHLSFKDNSPTRDTHAHKNTTNYHRHKHTHSHRRSHEYHGGLSKNDSFRGQGPSSKFSAGRNRVKRYAVSESKWEKQLVTYSIVRYPSRYNMKISTREIESAIQTAFHIWEQHISLKFEYRPNDIDVDIEISFASTHHGDSYPFDGPGKTLAHAFFPGSGIGGDVHFEQDEDWTLGIYSGVNLLYVAAHELGHSLGLGHSSDYGAIMYPWYRGYIPNMQLHTDDIRGIQTLYGSPDESFTLSPTRSTTTTTTTSTTTFRSYVNGTTFKTLRPIPDPDNDDLCKGHDIDAIITIFGDAILVFQGLNVYEIGKNGEGLLPGWPKPISSYFTGLEGQIDCALTRLNGKTYFFKGGKYWRFTGKKMDTGYPRTISEYFPGIPDNLDAAFEWDDEFVFVKGHRFWRFNTRKRPQVSSFFPMPISHWGLSKKISAAFSAPNQTVYFFQGQYFWEFDKNAHRIIRNFQGSRIASERWFGCQEP